MQAPTRILYAAPDLVPYPKGSGTRIEATVRALASQGARVTLVTPAPLSPEQAAARLAGIDGLVHHPVPVGGAGDNFLDRMLEFRRIVRTFMARGGWDVAWFRSPWEGLAALAEARSRGARVVYEAHGLPSIELPHHYPDLVGHPELLDKIVDDEARVLRGADVLVTPSRTGRSFLHTRGVEARRIHVIPNSAEPLEDPPDYEPPPGPPWRLLYVGTLAPWQGLGTLLEAMAAARGAPDLHLRVVGTLKGPWVRSMRQLISALRLRERVELVGPVPREHLPGIHRASHACVAPLPDDARNSLQGCCPIKILEYMATGRPILATRVRPVEEILEHGRTGWLVAPGSPWALLTGLRTLLSRPDAAREMGRAARAEVARAWTPAIFEARLGEVLRELRAGRADSRWSLPAARADAAPTRGYAPPETTSR